MSRNSNNSLARAVTYFRSGDLDSAARLLKRILVSQPRDFHALHLLGLIKAMKGDPSEAVKLFNKALLVNDRVAELHSNMAKGQVELGCYDDALLSYDKIIALGDGRPEILLDKGSTLTLLERHEEALAVYDAALALRPDYADAWSNRGTVLDHLRKHDEALESFDKANVLAPNHANAWTNRGIALDNLKRFDEALACHDKALAINPSHAKAWCNRGVTLHNLDRCDEALGCYEQALAIEPYSVETHNNRGNALWKLRRWEEALASYNRTLVLDPDNVYALYNRSKLSSAALMRYEQVIEDFDRLLKLNPARITKFRDTLLHARMMCCDWRDYEQESRCLIADIRAESRITTPHTCLFISSSIEDHLTCARSWANSESPVSGSALWKGERYLHDRIRIAYVSFDLRDHPVGKLIADLIERHDKTRFETIAISLSGERPSEAFSRLKRAFERFIDVARYTDNEVAHLLHELEIDIAVDLNGHTWGARPKVFEMRPAPVQVNYLGYPGTLGANYSDYIICDRTVIPPEHQSDYTEKAVYLPDTYLVTDSTLVIAERTPSRAEAGLPEHGFVFCAFCSPYKITPAMFDLWMRLLHRVEGSVLWLLVSNANATAMRNLLRVASERGIAPQRLVFAQRADHAADHLARQRLADLFLDTLPYNSHSSAAEALWAGLPMLTCMGTAFAGRVAASLLQAVGLPELIACSLQEYEALAFRLATEPGMLTNLKAKLASNRLTFPLFDTDRYRRHIEAAYLAMWERSQRGEPPVSFAVEAEH